MKKHLEIARKWCLLSGRRQGREKALFTARCKAGVRGELNHIQVSLRCFGKYLRMGDILFTLSNDTLKSVERHAECIPFLVWLCWLEVAFVLSMVENEK